MIAADDLVLSGWAARRLGVAQLTIHRWTAAGLLPTVATTMEGTRLYSRATVDAFAAEREAQPPRRRGRQPHAVLPDGG